MRSGLGKLLRDCGSLRHGSFVLSSGEESSFYVDIKRASTQPRVLREMARDLAGRMMDEEIECDRLAGVVLGSIPLVVALSLEVGVPYLMVRREKKEHGVRGEVEGLLDPGDRVVVVEDVVTTARSVADAVVTLRERGAVVREVMAVVDRESGGRQLLASMGIKFITLLTARDLMED